MPFGISPDWPGKLLNSSTQSGTISFALLILNLAMAWKAAEYITSKKQKQKNPH